MLLLYHFERESQEQMALFQNFLADRGVSRSVFLFLAKQKSQPKLTRLLFRSWRYG